MNEFDELIERVADSAMDYMDDANFHPDKFPSSKMELATYKSLLKYRINALRKERDEAVEKLAKLAQENQELKEAIKKIDKCFWYGDAHKIAKEALRGES